MRQGISALPETEIRLAMLVSTGIKAYKWRKSKICCDIFVIRYWLRLTLGGVKWEIVAERGMMRCLAVASTTRSIIKGE